MPGSGQALSLSAGSPVATQADRSQPVPAPSAPAILPIGRIVGTHGVRGELKLLLFNPESEAITEGLTLVLRKADREKSLVVTSLRPHKRFLLIRLQECDSMTAAEEWIGADACIHPADLPPIGPDEIYHHELLGMQVATVEGRELGRIIEILETPAHDVCTVRGSGREYLIPLVAHVIREVDKVHQRLIIDPPSGLLDL